MSSAIVGYRLHGFPPCSPVPPVVEPLISCSPHPACTMISCAAAKTSGTTASISDSFVR